jgi:hypothetical protein
VDTPESETRGAPAHHGGRTTTMRSERGAHPLPHERDESTDAPVEGAGATGTPSGGPTELGRRAQQDVEHGLADTSRGETSDETYARSFRADATTPAHRRAPSGSRH